MQPQSCCGQFTGFPLHRENGKWWKVISDREYTGNLNIQRDQFKNQENRSRKMAAQCREFYVWIFQCCNFFFKNTQGKLKSHRENTGKMQGILLSDLSGNHEFMSSLTVACQPGSGQRQPKFNPEQSRTCSLSPMSVWYHLGLVPRSLGKSVRPPYMVCDQSMIKNQLKSPQVAILVLLKEPRKAITLLF